MTVKVAAHEVVDLRLRGRVQVLELVHRLELDDVETVREDAIGLVLEQVLALVRGDVRNRREHVRAVRQQAFDAVSVVDSALARLVVDIEVLEIVVEIDGARAEVTSEQGRVGGEDSSNVDMALAAQGDRETGLPLVEVRNDSLVLSPGNVL